MQEWIDWQKIVDKSAKCQAIGHYYSILKLTFINILKNHPNSEKQVADDVSASLRILGLNVLAYLNITIKVHACPVRVTTLHAALDW